MLIKCLRQLNLRLCLVGNDDKDEADESGDEKGNRDNRPYSHSGHLTIQLMKCHSIANRVFGGIQSPYITMTECLH